MNPVDFGDCDHAGKRRGIADIAGELDDPQGTVLVGAEVRREIGERLSGRVDHAADVVVVPGVMVDLDRDAIPLASRHLVPRRCEGEVVRDGYLGPVVEVAPSALDPLPLQLARRDGDLVDGGGYRGLEVDAVGVRRAGRAPPCGEIVDAGNVENGLQSALPPLVGIGELPLRVVADDREEVPLGEEGAVAGERDLRAVVDEALGSPP